MKTVYFVIERSRPKRWISGRWSVPNGGNSISRASARWWTTSTLSEPCSAASAAWPAASAACSADSAGAAASCWIIPAAPRSAVGSLEDPRAVEVHDLDEREREVEPDDGDQRDHEVRPARDV